MSKSKGTIKRLDRIFSEIGLEAIPDGDGMSLSEAISIFEESGGSPEARPRVPLETCGTQGKICYPTPQFVRAVIKKRKSRDSGPLREYRCPDCGFYHISSSI